MMYFVGEETAGADEVPRVQKGFERTVSIRKVSKELLRSPSLDGTS